MLAAQESVGAMKNWLGLMLGTVAITMWVGCGGGGSGASGGSTTPPAISVAFSTAPPASLQVSATAQVAATVTNDASSGGGVDWSCAPASACGSFSPTHTASGTATTYTAPSSVPSGGVVTITATSTADSTKSAAGKTTITAPAISFNPPAPASLDVNQATSLTAVVTGDSSKAGVDWSCTPVNACGTFNPTHTASGAATAYTAPSSAVTAVVKAASTADPSAFATASIKIFGVAIAYYPQPTPSLLTSDPNPTPIIAVVSNDISNAGVDWTCTGVCGTLGQPHTASGVANTYTTTTAGAALITATATADPTQMVQSTITASTIFGLTTLSGNYVFELSGIDANGPYRLAGTLQTDGAGNITGGEQNYENLSTTGEFHDSFTGTFSTPIGADGRGVITVNTGDMNVGVAGVETFAIVVLDGTKALIAQFDSSATSSGTLDLQTPKSQLSGGYAFVVSGVNLAASPKPLGWGGVFNVDSPGTISGHGSIADEIDNTTVQTAQTLSGTVTSADPLGKVVINLNAGFALNGVTLVGYLIDNTHVKLVEQDSFGVTGGTAYGQGAGTGKFTASSFPANVAFATEGLSGASAPYAPTVYAGSFAASAGSLAGLADENAGGTNTTDAALAGNYAVDSSGTGRVTTSNITLGGNPGPTWVFYLTGDASVPALTLQIDNTPIETAGALYTQTGGGSYTGSSFNLNYGMNFTAFPTATTEDDGTGQVIASSGTTLAGTMDTNYDFTVMPGEALTGAFVPSANGRFTGTLSEGAVFAGPATVVFYMVDNAGASGSSSRALFIENDAQPAIGIFRQQEQ